MGDREEGHWPINTTGWWLVVGPAELDHIVSGLVPFHFAGRRRAFSNRGYCC